jgi:hypothetical protein
MNVGLFLRRVGAMAIDVAILFALDFFITIGLSATPLGNVSVGELELRLRWPLIAAYFIGFWTVAGTPGMRQMQLVLMTSTGDRPSLVAAIIRFAVLGGLVALSGETVLLLVVPYAIAIALGFSAHDRLARTVVLRTAKSGAGAAAIVARSAWVLGLFFAGLMLAGILLGILGGGFGDPGPR